MSALSADKNYIIDSIRTAERDVRLSTTISRRCMPPSSLTTSHPNNQARPHRHLCCPSTQSSPPECQISWIPSSRTRSRVPVDRPFFESTPSPTNFVAHDAQELLSLRLCQRFRHQVCWVQVRADFPRGEPARFGSLLYPQILHVDVLRFAQTSAVDQAHRR